MGHHNRLGRLGKPPSQRKSKSSNDWQELLRGLVHGLFDIHLAATPLKGVTGLRAAVINDVRLTLDAEVLDKDLFPVVDGEQHIAVAEVLRLAMAFGKFDWKNPISAETVMVIVQRELEKVSADLEKQQCPSDAIDGITGKPWTWQLRLSRITQMTFKMDRQLASWHSLDETRDWVLDKFEEAFEPTKPSDLSEADVPNRDGIGTRREQVAPVHVMFRIALWNDDIDWHEPANASMARQVVEETLAAELDAA